MKKTLLLSALALLLGAWSFGSVTWGNGANQINLPDGGVCLILGYGLDGGWIDGGPLTDGGIFLETDGGVCADGGLSCQACSGTCNVDGGPQYTVPTDGGFAYGGASSFTGQSDPFPANYMFNVTGIVPNSGSGAGIEVAFTADLLGSNDKYAKADGGIWSTYPGTDAGCQVDGGPGCTISWAQGMPLLPYESISITSNHSDGGMACFPFTAQ